MPSKRTFRLHLGAAALLLSLLALLGPAATPGLAAGAPAIGEVWASSVFSNTARLRAEINPSGAKTTFHIDYITAQAYEDNVDASLDPFTNTSRIPESSEAVAGSGEANLTVLQIVSSLAPGTAYRYRFVAQNANGTKVGTTYGFATQPLGGTEALPDGRGWEMVSPIDKNGGQVEAPEALAAGGVLQAAADGQRVTYGSAASFGSGSQGAAIASQYIASRSAEGWVTENITAPLYSASYGSGDEGVPYQLFSEDLGSALLLNGRHCRGDGTSCAVPNPPIAGTGAPAGYQNYYLRDNQTGSFQALLGPGVGGALALEPADFELSLAGASANLRKVVLATCAALTPDAMEIEKGSGCDRDKPNLYLYDAGTLTLVNVKPNASQGTPGAALGAQSAAVSADGSRIYWTDLSSGSLYLREPGTSRLVDLGSSFETASSDGSIAFYTKGGHLYRFDATAGTAADLTPSGGVEGVLGSSVDGSTVYYATTAGLFMREGGTTTPIAGSADESNYPPASRTARVSADGNQLVFMATEPLTGYDNEDLASGEPDPQVYLYDAEADELRCVSCNPTMGRPVGPSRIPGAYANGSGPAAIDVYKPRVLSSSGNRVFFESADALAQTDTNGRVDVYQWEAAGTGSCTRTIGCVELISSGRSTQNSTFIDASAVGDDAFFITDSSLVSGDLAGSIDLYDARVGGGFPDPVPSLACDGDACQSLPPVPVDPTLTTRLSGPGNPGIRYPNQHVHCKGGYVKQKGKCVKRKSRKKRDGKGNRRTGR